MESTTYYEPNLTLFQSKDGPMSPRFLTNENIIQLDGSVKSSLNWDEQLDTVDPQSLILWDLKLEPLNFTSAFDPLCFSSAKIALETFVDKVLPQFPRSFGVILSKSTATPADIKEANNSHHYFDVISHELHRRGALLPEELMAFALFDLSNIESPTDQAYLFSEERFPHIQLGLKGAHTPLFGLRWEDGYAQGGVIDAAPLDIFEPTLGICLPKEANINEKQRAKFDHFFERLNEKQQAYRIIHEEFFNESWYGLDEIVVMLEAMDPVNGPRLCEGFKVSGGVIKNLHSN